MLKRLSRSFRNPIICKKIQSRVQTPKVKLAGKNNNRDYDGYFLNDLSGDKHTSSEKSTYIFLLVRVCQIILLTALLLFLGHVKILPSIFIIIEIIILEYYLNNFNPIALKHLKFWTILINLTALVFYQNLIISLLLLVSLVIAIVLPNQMVFYSLR
jgi:hypothetical protein